ncbi:MAG: M15 family metallopeptidase [Gammaproteobacteria bacterium]|nr:M15 family metallopeptidase [Gammaproteobacteria bacterium]MCZ6717423.1 M15 family metallopeptidase [Gammaproteobacteria bacterium]
MLSAAQLTGRKDSHVLPIEELGIQLHPLTAQAFLALKAMAADDGIELEAVSAFRTFNTQREIWNAKYRGDRPLYDVDGVELEHSVLNKSELVTTILRWSALPGASRHHWGTDLDIIDRAAVPEGYRVRLMKDEFASDGVFWKLGDWLDSRLSQTDFYRPYMGSGDGIQSEPWHLSFAPVSVQALQSMTIAILEEALADSDVLGLDTISAQLPEIFSQYVLNVSDPP